MDIILADVAVRIWSFIYRTHIFDIVVGGLSVSGMPVFIDLCTARLFGGTSLTSSVISGIGYLN
jgi:hypothetical protein